MTAQELLNTHGAHWRAVAGYLGVCTGGVDVPVEEPGGNAAMIIAAIEKKKISAG